MGRELTSSAVPTITLPVLSRGVQQNQQHGPLIPEDLDNLELPLGGSEERRMPLVVAISNIKGGSPARNSCPMLWCQAQRTRIPVAQCTGCRGLGKVSNRSG